MKCQRDLSKKLKIIKTMDSKMTTNSQLSTTEPKKQNLSKTTGTGTESRKWRSHGEGQGNGG